MAVAARMSLENDWSVQGDLLSHRPKYISVTTRRAIEGQWLQEARE
jgi:hypothetical protein